MKNHHLRDNIFGTFSKHQTYANQTVTLVFFSHLKVSGKSPKEGEAVKSLAIFWCINVWPIGSAYAIFAYIWWIFVVKSLVIYQSHGSYFGGNFHKDFPKKTSCMKFGLVILGGSSQLVSVVTNHG